MHLKRRKFALIFLKTNTRGGGFCKGNRWLKKRFNLNGFSKVFNRGLWLASPIKPINAIQINFCPPFRNFSSWDFSSTMLLEFLREKETLWSVPVLQEVLLNRRISQRNSSLSSRGKTANFRVYLWLVWQLINSNFELYQSHKNF